ncbi:hypothetical protein WA577_005525 [Blastocystis sp. JDR]
MDQMDQSVRKEFEELVERTREEAENIMQVEMPKKLVFLNDFSREILDSISEVSTDVDMESTTIASNEKICKLLERIKQELWDMINYIITVKFFIMLNQPRKEDGNTFGVEVQNEIVSDLTDSLESARQILSDMIQYFSTRGSYVVSSLNNPHVADFISGVSSFDNKELLLISQNVIDIRNTYAALYDKIMKNYDKIVKPRGTHTGLKWDTMY